MTQQRYISTGVWLYAQDKLMTIAVTLGLLGISVIPVVLLYIGEPFSIAYLTMGASVVLMLYLILLAFVLDYFRMNGIPVIESV